MMRPRFHGPRSSRTRAVAGLAALIACVACAPLQPAAVRGDDWDSGLRRLNEFVGRAAFQPTGVTRIEPIARCEARVVTRWHAATAAAKRYADVSNVAVLDFGRDIERVEFVPAHTVQRDGGIEVWRNRIAIVVRPGFEDEFHFRRPDDAEPQVRRGETDDVTVGVVDAPDPAEVDAFIQAATQLVAYCRATRPGGAATR